MPRGKKNPVTEMPVNTELTQVEVQPILGEPSKFKKPQSPANSSNANVLPFTGNSLPESLNENPKDWMQIDAVLADIVNFT